MIDHLTVIHDETERLIDAVTAVDPSSPVPSCPDWTADDLLWHLTEVHAFWAGILSSGALTDEQSGTIEAAKPARPDAREDVVALLRRETDTLIDQLSNRPDDQPAWSWFPSDQTVGFTRRMQVHEAVMHRIDAELTAGRPVTLIPTEVAADSMRHVIEVMFSWWGTLPGFVFTPGSGLVSLDASDSAPLLVQPGRWTGVGESGQSYDQPGLVIVEGGGDPVARTSGTAEELARWLWGRGAEPTSEGDATALDAVRAVQEQGAQ